MNPNMNMHGLPQPQMGGVSGGGPVPNTMMASPQQPGNVVIGPGPGPSPMPPNAVQQQQQQQQQQHQQQQAAEKIDNISKVKSLLAPLRESLFLMLRAGAYTLHQNNKADNLNREGVCATPPRFDKHLEDFYAYCDQIELHLKTAIQCMQQLSSAQHYLPGVVTTVRMDMMHDNPAGPMPYPAYLNTVRVHVQSAKDMHDTLISAAQNISQAD